MNKQILKVPKKVIGIKSKKVEKTGMMTSKTEKHNKEVMTMNMGFTSRLEQMENEYEDSIESWESFKTPGGGYRRSYVFSSEDEGSVKNGNLIVMNIDLGPQRNGIQVLKALDN